MEIIKLYKYLVDDKKDYTLSKQVLRSGTSIGANINEALSSESKKDFIHKLSVALKEVKETAYWLHLLFDSKYIPVEIFRELYDRCSELNKMLTSIILTTKNKYLAKKTI